jgi:hypothetical protein
MKREYWLIAAALAIVGAIVLSGRAIAPKLSAPAPQQEQLAAGNQPGHYRNSKYGFEMTYPTDAHIAPIGADGKPDPEGTMFAMSKEGNTVELYAYEPAPKEKDLSALDFAKQAALGSDHVALMEAAAVASFKEGIVRFGERALVGQSDSAAFFIKRPGYFLIGMLYGPVALDPRQVKDVLRSISFP